MLSGATPQPGDPQTPAPPMQWAPPARSVTDLAAELRDVIDGRPGWAYRGRHPEGVVHAEYAAPARPDGPVPGGSVSGGGTSGWWWTAHDGTDRPLVTPRFAEWTAADAVNAVETAATPAPEEQQP